MTAQWSVYIIETAAGSYYTGVATDPAARYRDHEAGRGARAVRMAGGPRRILWQLDGLDRGGALRLERAIKALSRPAKEHLVANGPEAVGITGRGPAAPAEGD